LATAPLPKNELPDSQDNTKIMEDNSIAPASFFQHYFSACLFVLRNLRLSAKMSGQSTQKLSAIFA
jgi:hypothetical protein